MTTKYESDILESVKDKQFGFEEGDTEIKTHLNSKNIGKYGNKPFALYMGDKVERLSKLIVQAKKIVYSFVCVEDRYFDLIGSNDYGNEDYKKLELAI